MRWDEYPDAVKAAIPGLLHVQGYRRQAQGPAVTEAARLRWEMLDDGAKVAYLNALALQKLDEAKAVTTVIAEILGG